MGVVYLAYEPLMHRIVALKVLQRDSDQHEVYAKSARFLAEAMLTGRLAHAGIIPIYHVGFDQANGYFYSMRYLRGKTLHQVMRERQKHELDGTEEYPLTRLLDVMVRVCDAVAFAHRNGVLHRDLKPANVMITDSNEVLVVDWGLAKDLRRKTIIAVFGTDMKVVPFSASDSTMAIVQNMEREGNTVQHSTHAYLALMWGYDDFGRIVSPIPAQPLKVDRIVIVSDMACYGQDNLGQLLEEYRRTVNPDVKYYSINMSGQDQSQVDPLDKNALLISGWSESIFTLIREFEGLKTDGEKQDVSVPAIELLRERFREA